MFTVFIHLLPPPSSSTPVIGPAILMCVPQWRERECLETKKEKEREGGREGEG